MPSDIFRHNKRLIIVFFLAFFLKLALFSYASLKAPQSKFLVDSSDYLATASTLAQTGSFARQNPDGSLHYEHFRTPGYPFFLAVFHFIGGIPLEGIILIQIFLNLLSAVFTYKTAMLIDQRLAFLSAVIMLFDPSITVFSLMVLTESLFLFFMSLLMFFFVKYLKSEAVKWLVVSAVILAAATYIKPVTYYLALFLAVFIALRALRSTRKMFVVHGILFMAIVYVLLGVWQYRNYQIVNDARFSSITVFAKSKGLYKSYERHDDRITQGLNPAFHYLNTVSRSVLILFTKPPSLKYFESDYLKWAGKIISYPFIIFWMVGLLIGLSRSERQSPFLFASIVVIYFVGVTVTAVLWREAPRFRVPMMPFIALLASHGWAQIRPKGF
ncbi:MAG TPA: glycosyltransferase family 39 protein [Candidatus Omnitrophota bacterium]|nr:glycosyltransferase family 39 protein [Candidatus Omnitrophota bacterium]